MKERSLYGLRRKEKKAANPFQGELDRNEFRPRIEDLAGALRSQRSNASSPASGGPAEGGPAGANTSYQGVTAKAAAALYATACAIDGMTGASLHYNKNFQIIRLHLNLRMNPFAYPSQVVPEAPLAHWLAFWTT